MHNCIHCGEESRTRNTSRKYCSNKCQKAYEWEQKKLIIEADSHLGTSVHNKSPLLKYLKEKDNSCSSCGITEWNNKPIVLEIDHINGIRMENYLSNVRLLCPNCHSQTPNFKGANKGAYAGVAQLAEHETCNFDVGSSILLTSSNI